MKNNKTRIFAWMMMWLLAFNSLDPAITAFAEENPDSVIVSENAISEDPLIGDEEGAEINAQSVEAVECGIIVVKKQKIDITPYFYDVSGISKYKIAKKERKYATVTKAGILKAVKKGSVTVLALDQEKNILKAVKVDVVSPKLVFEQCNSLNVKIEAGQNLTDSSVLPSSWGTSTPGLCSVDPETGTVTPLARGNAVIVARYVSGNSTVKVSGKLKIRVPLLSAKKITIPLNETRRLKLKKVPDKALPIEWNSADISIATVDQDGLVHPVAKGSTSVNAVYNGMTFTCDVTVKEAETKTSGTFVIDLGDGKTGTVKGRYDIEASDELLRLVNQYRKENGLNTLEKSDELEETGFLRGREIGYKYSHTRPNGELCFTAFPEHSEGGENICGGYSTAKEMFEAWKKSPGHNANMLYPGFTHASMKVFIREGGGAPGERNYVYYGVQCFIKERSW